MMRALLLTFGLLLAGCSKWPVFSPSPWPEPKDLGVRVGSSNELDPAEGSVVDANEHVYVLFKTRGGVDDDFRPIERTSAVFELGRDTKQLTKLPAAPFELDALWGAATPRGFLAQGAGAGLASFDGEAWTVLPDSPAAFRYVHRADARRVFASSGGGVFMLADGAWRDLSEALGRRPRESVLLGPWTDAAARLVWVEPAGPAFQVCTQLVDTTSLAALDQPSCGVTQTRPSFLGDAVNGTVDDFQVLFSPLAGHGAQVWRFVGGAWVPGSFITAAGLFQTPQSAGLCVLPFEGGLTLMRVAEGKAAETLFTSMAGVLGCSFEAPLSRDCPIRMSAMAQTVNSACTRSWFAIASRVDARDTVFVNSLALPHHDATCAPACAANLLCRAGPGGLGVCDRDPVFDSYEQPLGPTSAVILNASGVLPADPVVTAWNPASGAPLVGFMSFVDQSARTVVRGPPGTVVRLQLHLDGYEDRELIITMPDEGNTADLGTLFFIKGHRLGLAPAGLGGAAVRLDDAGASLVLPVMAADGGGALMEAREASDGGLRLRALAPSDAVASTPLVSSSGEWVLWSDGSGLSALRASSGERFVLSTEAAWQVRLAVFSGDERAVAVPNAVGVVVFGLDGTPTERFRATPTSGAVQLSFDGATMLRQVGASFVLSTTVDSHAVSSATQAVLSGDGSRIYTAAGAAGALTLSVQSTAAGAPLTTVATGVRAFTVDPGGGDVLFDGLVNGAVRVSRYSATSGLVSMVQSGLAGSAESSPSGALWVRDATSTTVFFPFSSAAGRRFIGSQPFTFDGHGALLSPTGLRVTPTSSSELPPGPGVFGALSTRQLSGTSVIILNGGAGPRPVDWAAPSAGTMVDPLFTSTTGLPSYFAPCAPVLLPTKTFAVAANGAVTTAAGPSELFCEMDPRRH